MNPYHGNRSRGEPTPAEPPLDPKVLSSLRELGVRIEKDVLGEVVALFLDRLPGDLETLRSALDGADAPALERAAHSLKGGAGNVGAARLAALAAELETHAREGALEACARPLQALESEVEATAAALRAEVA